MFFLYIFEFPDDENFEPNAPAVPPASANKWEGEDEDDDVKVYICILFKLN